MTTQLPSRCPVCQEQAQQTHAPFCSKKCHNLDLIRWMDGRYRIPAEPASPEDLAPVETSLSDDSE